MNPITYNALRALGWMLLPFWIIAEEIEARRKHGWTS